MAPLHGIGYVADWMLTPNPHPPIESPDPDEGRLRLTPPPEPSTDTYRPKTMRIASADTEYGYVIINVADFDPATMVEYTGA